MKLAQTKMRWVWSQHYSSSSFMFASFLLSDKTPSFSFKTPGHHFSFYVWAQKSPLGTPTSAVGGRQWWAGDVQYIGDTPQVSAYKGHLSVNATSLQAHSTKLRNIADNLDVTRYCPSKLRVAVNFLHGNRFLSNWLASHHLFTFLILDDVFEQESEW